MVQDGACCYYLLVVKLVVKRNGLLLRIIYYNLHLVFVNYLSCDCIIYQYSGKLKSEWILYQNIIIHRHLKGWSQHSSNGMNGTVAFPIFLLQFDKEQLCIGCFHTSYRLFAKCFLRKQSLHCNI